jgi:uncharacterized membrane protein YdjX (TVP38/TMEM64 family)
MAKFLEKLVLISVLVLVIVVSLEMTDFGKELTLAKIQKAAFKLKEQVQNHYLITAAIFICGYMVLNVWFPAAGVLTLLGGFLYGPVMGTIFVELAAVLGALLTFEVGRYIVRGWVQKAWGKHLRGFDDEVKRHGYMYLLMVRLFPLVPYILVNFLAGLTKVRLWTFLWTTALGSLPGIVIFCYFGHKLLNIKSIDQLFTPDVIIAACLFAGFLTTVFIIQIISDRKKREVH